MPKGLWIAHVDVTDPEGHGAHVAASAAAFRRHGGRFLVRGGSSQNPEGRRRARHVVTEFPDDDSALACYRSPEYAAAKDLRRGRSVMDCAIVEGYDGAQP